MEPKRNNSNDLEKFQTEENGSTFVPDSTSNTAIYDKSQSLVDIANNTFKELCRTLENEQSKLLELEERRKKLQEEMQHLKLEIEKEKHTYRFNLVESLTENAEEMCPNDITRLQSDSSSEFQRELYTCYESEEVANGAEISPTSYSAGEDRANRSSDITHKIREELLDRIFAEGSVGDQRDYDGPNREVSAGTQENSSIIPPSSKN